DCLVLPLPVSFVVQKQKELVPHKGSTHAGAELVPCEFGFGGARRDSVALAQGCAGDLRHCSSSAQACRKCLPSSRLSTRGTNLWRTIRKDRQDRRADTAITDRDTKALIDAVPPQHRLGSSSDQSPGAD